MYVRKIKILVRFTNILLICTHDTNTEKKPKKTLLKKTKKYKMIRYKKTEI